MENEKFDSNLSSVVLVHDERFVPVFDRNKVWKKSRRDRKRRLLAAISVASIFIIAFSFVLPLNEKPSAHKQYPITSAIKKVGDTDSIDEKTAPSVFPKQPIAGKDTHVLNKKAELTNTPDKITPDSLPLNNSILAASIPPLAIGPLNKLPDTVNDVKITFKRGKSQETPEPDMKITFLKGKNLRFKQRSAPLPDSAYYVNSNPFKIKFKH